ncbi:MAG: class I poly(R)-hydroxyalkanoic acid synthase [Casimicrobiaceae bacterium]
MNSIDAPVSPLFDAGAVVALNERFAPRVRALWSSMMGEAAPTDGAQGVDDRRFASRAWRELPYYALLKQSYLLYSDYLRELAAIAQLAPHDRQRLQFATRQYLDAIAPTNFPVTNPDVLERALETDGQSLMQGWTNLVADAARGRITMTDEAAFEVGRNLAVTPGSVVFRNDLIELIQYDATTPTVHARPLVIVPPCINKYYILDLTPANSLVRHAVAQGHTVFMISWRNIPADQGALTWDDYIERGALEAIRAAREISGGKLVNALGFCVGGTLLACTLAVLAARRHAYVASATFLTTMLDFTDPGEIGVYITREGLAAREPVLMTGQRVHGSELANAFASLRANELVWNYVVNNYLKGRTPPAFDLLYWNGDSSNLPGPMYVYYLREMYLDNRLREPNALTMAGARIDLSKIRMPVYVYASRDDHIVPWRSAFRTTALVGGETTFVLGASGHIAGVVNPPAPQKRNYWVNTANAADADAWLDGAASVPGSWWPHWYRWLERHAGVRHPAPAAVGDADHPPLMAAPGNYVLDDAH